MDAVQIVYAGAERLDEIEPVWWTLHAHHLEVDYPRHAKLRQERQTWETRSADFRHALESPDSFLVLAESGEDGVVGFALIHLKDNDNWRITGDRYAELESLAVAPPFRGRGLGKRLLEAAYARLRSLGVREIAIVVVHANEDARRFYEREGFTPWHATYFGPIPPGDSAPANHG